MRVETDVPLAGPFLYSVLLNIFAGVRVFSIPSLTSDILAVSLDAPGSPSININLPNRIGGSHSLGWGFGWYPGDHQSAMVAKDSAARGTQVLMDALIDWSNFRSTVF